MFRKYNKWVYCYYKKNNPIKEPISLSELWGLFVDYTEKNYPKYMAYITAIAQFIGRHHATVINSIKNAESYLNDEDPIFMGIYDETYKKYKEYVGIISKDTEV